MIKIDTNSQEFKDELAKTIKFTDKVCSQFNFVYNPNNEINEAVSLGLSRNKMIYGKRYCPCFMVEGETEDERKAADNRICPCKPALEVEIPTDGYCHCGIFCTPEYASQNTMESSETIESNQPTTGLSKEECETLLEQREIDGDELVALLEAREQGSVDFILVDNREWMENKSLKIAGTDFLVPTTSFYESLKQIEEKKDTKVIVYCFSGSRSASCQQVMIKMGYSNVTNLAYGISSFRGEVL